AQPIARVCPGLHESVARIVDRALAYEKNDRWPSASAFQTAVRQAAAVVPGGPSLARSRQLSGAHSDPTIATASAAISASTNRSETLTTGRPFSSEVRSFSSPRTPRIWVGAGAVLVLLVGAVVIALRPIH